MKWYRKYIRNTNAFHGANPRFNWQWDETTFSWTHDSLYAPQKWEDAGDGASPLGDFRRDISNDQAWVRVDIQDPL
jgi:hypothetical protein